jgi:ribose transport system substrate-binding protein
MMEEHMKRVTVLTVALAAGALALTACGGSSTTDSDQAVVETPVAEATPADEATPTAEAAPDPLLEAIAYLDTRLSNPTSIGIDMPLSKKPEEGKLIVRLLTPVGIQTQIDLGNAEAAKALGWEYKSIPISADADGIQKAFQTALDMKPDGISYGGYPASIITEQLQAALDAGIAVVPDSAVDTPGSAPGINVMLDGIPEQLAWGKDLAAYVAVDSECAANVKIFTVSAFPILEPVVTGFTDYLKAICPEATVEVVDQTLADIGTNTPKSVVSTLQRDPSANYLLYTFGDLATGVGAALDDAGLTQQAKTIGSAVSTGAIQNIRDGKDAAWVGLPPDILGWRTVDAFARIFNGDSLDPANAALLPSQIITQENVEGIVLDENGFYNAVSDYQEQFKKLWLVN